VGTVDTTKYEESKFRETVGFPYSLESFFLVDSKSSNLARIIDIISWRCSYSSEYKK
jgi:hypothetical protein